MKKTIILLMAFIYVSINSSAQEEDQTLFGDDNLTVRAFMGFNVKGLELNNQIGVLSGVEVDLVINHKFNIGFYGYGMLNDVVNENVIPDKTLYYKLGYGGLKLEPVLYKHKLIHFTIPVNFGVGGISLNEPDPMNDYGWGSTLFDFDTYVFAEPGLGVEINLFKNLRLNASAGYMFTDKINITGNLSQPLDGWTGNLSLRFGWF